MKGYVIAIRRKIINPEEMAIYAQKGAGTLPADARPLAVYGRHEVLEGDPLDAALVVEFPSFEIAKKWYNSPDYQAARLHRLKGADYQFIVLEGL